MNQSSTIFIIDDERDVAYLLAKQIRSMGYDVHCFFDGKDVVENVVHKHPSLLLLDIQLPDVSGFDIFRQLRATEKAKNIPVIFFSAHSSKEKYCLQLGAEGFIKKPYELDDLKSLIHRLL